MGIDDWIDGKKSRSGSTTKHYDTSSRRYRWSTKIDFGSPYILVARDAEGNVYKHRDHLAILDDRLDWRRLDDHPEKDMEVLYEVPSERRWLEFCSRAVDQLDIDPEQYLDERPEELAELRERVHFPKRTPPDQTRDCRVCGENSGSSSVTMLEIDLQTKRRVPVCSSHTIDELAHNGLLE